MARPYQARIPARYVNFGQHLRVLVEDACEGFRIAPTDLYRAVGGVTGASYNTIRALTLMEDVPPLDGTAVDLKYRERAVVLLIAIDLSPESFGLGVEDLSPQLRKAGPAWIRREVRKLWAARDSNPEPTDSGLKSDLTCVRA